MAVAIGKARSGVAEVAPGCSAGQRLRDRGSRPSKAGAPEFEQVVGGGDELPLRPAGGEPAAEEAVAAPNGLDLGEDRLDYLLTSAVERSPLRGREHRLDPPSLVALAGCELARFYPSAVPGGDEHVDALLAHLADRARVPVAAVRQHGADRLFDPGLVQGARGSRDHRGELVCVVV